MVRTASEGKTGSKFNMTPKQLIAIVGIGALALFATWGIIFLATPRTGLLPGQEEFDVTVTDGMLNVELDTEDFDFTIYGTTNVDDWISYDELDNGTDLGDLTSFDFDDADYDEYDYFVIKYNGTVTQVWYEDNYDEDWDLGAMTYYERWAVLDITSTNALVAYQQPSSAGMMAFDSESGAEVNVTAIVAAQTNITLIAFTNKTQTDAAYVKGPLYSNDEINNAPAYIINCNETIDLSAIKITNTLSVSRINATSLRFEFYMLGAAVGDFDLIWGKGVTSIGISSIELVFGENTNRLAVLS